MDATPASSLTNTPALPALQSDLQVTVHCQGATVWYAIKSSHQRFVRCGRLEYLIASALNGQRSASDVIAAVREVDASIALEPDDVMNVAGWLGKAGLLQLAGNPTQVAPSQKLRLNPIYTKIPLFKGELLERLGGWLAPAVSWPTMAIALALWLVAAAAVLANWNSFATATGRLFVADGWLWWGVAWLVLKTAHELGHAVMAVRVGSPIRSAGISLIFLAPVPYVDLSDLWTIPNRYHRMLCCAGGMLVEITLAAIAAIVALTTENQSLQYFCCALATMGTFTTLAFNASPLIRFDGYYILSDWINYPNLYTDAQTASKQFISFCLRPWRSTAGCLSAPLVIYGLACFQYRMIMMLSLAIGTILALQGIGVALVAWGAYATLLAPMLNARAVQRARASSSEGNSQVGSDAGPDGRWFDLIAGKRWEAVGSGTMALALCLLLAYIPSPLQPSTPGYVALRDPHWIRTETDGFLTEIVVRNDARLATGDLIARLSNPELELELKLKRLELQKIEETIALKRAQGQLAELQTAQAQGESLALHVAQLECRVNHLEVRSPSSGRLVQNDMENRRGLFLKAGEPLAMVAGAEELEVVGSVSQTDVAAMRTQVGQTLDAHVSGGATLRGQLRSLEPRARDQLESPLLAAAYGGPIPVQLQTAPSGEEELKLTHPRFDLRLNLTSEMAEELSPGQLVWIRNPGPQTSLLSACTHWLQNKWQEIVQQSQMVN